MKEVRIWILTAAVSCLVIVSSWLIVSLINDVKLSILENKASIIEVQRTLVMLIENKSKNEEHDNNIDKDVDRLKERIFVTGSGDTLTIGFQNIQKVWAKNEEIFVLKRTNSKYNNN